MRTASEEALAGWLSLETNYENDTPVCSGGGGGDNGD